MKTFRHGTLNGYGYHGCRCDECVAAQRAYAAGRARARTRNPPKFSADDPRHGTVNGYGNQRCRCDACRSAWADAVRERKMKRLALPVPPEAHGTDGGYGNWGCRCEPCRVAHAQAKAETRDRQSQGTVRPQGRPRMMHETHNGEPCSMCGACRCHEPRKSDSACERTGYLAVAQYLAPHEADS